MSEIALFCASFSHFARVLARTKHFGLYLLLVARKHCELVVLPKDNDSSGKAHRLCIQIRRRLAYGSLQYTHT